MASFSVSVTKGRGHLRHNNREIIANNIDKDRIHMNVVYKAETIEDAYEKLFGAELRRYNEGKKPSRQIHDYMQHIRESKNGEKPFYEVVVQVGNMYDCGYGTEYFKMATNVLDEYMKEFQKNNPNLYVFNAVLHLDEKTPHLHIDYIPVARGYQQGLQVRNSLDKALKQQGIGGKANKFESSSKHWQDREKDSLAGILREHGHERKPDTGLKRKHLSNEVFKATMQVAENEISQMPDKVKYQEPKFGKKDVVRVQKKDLEQLERKAKLNKVLEHSSVRITQDAKEKRAQAERVLADAEAKQREASALKDKYQALYIEQTSLRERYDTLYQAYEDRKQTIDRLEFQKRTEQAKRKDLEQSFDKAVEKATEPLKQELDAWKDVATEVIRSHNIVLKALVFVADRLPVKGVLRDILESALTFAKNHAQKHDYLRLLDGKVELTREVGRHMTTEMDFRNGERGKGVYAKDGTFLAKCDTRQDASKLFPNHDFRPRDRGGWGMDL